jgi:hypothetical protein
MKSGVKDVTSWSREGTNEAAGRAAPSPTL